MLPVTMHRRGWAYVAFLVALSGRATAHMELTTPYAIYSKSNPATPEANKDYSMTAPLDQTGADFPAKSRCTKEIVDAIEPVATLVAGKSFTWELGGTAVHNGGSCQVAISYDYCETMAVMASWIGGCPLDKKYDFEVPDIPPCDKCVFIWDWFNQSGNREMYQNAAVVAVSGSASEYTAPQIFRSNTFGKDVCSNPEGTDVVFPNPGKQIIYGGKYSDSDPPTAAELDCPDWDNKKDVTVSGSGSGPAAPADGEGEEGDSTTTAEGGGGDATATGGGDATATGAEDATATGGAGDTATGAAGGGDATATGGGAGATGAGEATTKATTAAGSTGTGSGSGGNTGSSPTSTSSSSTDSDNTEQFLLFAGAALALIAIAGGVICLLHRNGAGSGSGGGSYSRARGGGRRSRRSRSRGRYRDDDYDSYDSDDSTASDDSYEKKRSRHRRRR